MKISGWIAALAALAVVGCGSSNDTASSGTGGTATGTASSKGGSTGKTFKIVMIAKSNSNPVFQYAKTGAEAAAKEQRDRKSVV